MNTTCTVYKTAEFIGKRWTMLILLEIYKGTGRKRRYTELKRALPDITAKILSLRLKELKKNGMVKKKVDASTFPVKSEYSLTQSGREFIKVIQDMKKWALKWKVHNKVCENQTCLHCEF